MVDQGPDGFTIRLPFPPTPASRPRVTRWGTYYTKTYKSYRTLADTAIPRSKLPPIEGNLRADVEFVCPRPKTTKRINPRGDIDNYVKAILDAITGEKPTKKKPNVKPKGYWNDDDQIIRLFAHKRFAREGEDPHTRITVGTT